MLFHFSSEVVKSWGDKHTDSWDTSCIFVCFPWQEGDQRWVTTAGSALHLLHSLYGPFNKLYGIGRTAKVSGWLVTEHCQNVRIISLSHTDTFSCSAVSVPLSWLWLFSLFSSLYLSACPPPPDFSLDGLRVLEGVAGRGGAEASETRHWKCFSNWQRYRKGYLTWFYYFYFFPNCAWFIINSQIVIALPYWFLCSVFHTDVDFVTPLCSQVVYEGLVDDIFRIKCGECLYCVLMVCLNWITSTVLLNSHEWPWCSSDNL